MKRIVFAVLVFLALVVTFWDLASALEQTSTGFFWPIGKANFETKNGWWLSKDPDYFPGKYHVGVDMFTYSKNADAYAIADGTIKAISVNGWGEGNCALAIEHKTDSGSIFVAVYGHLICDTIAITHDVYPGQPLGKTGDYNGIHLHFVIHDGPYNSMAKSGWGMMSVSQWTNPCNGNEKCTNGFVNPVDFIKNHSPYVKYDEITTACVGNICWEPRSKSCEDADSWYRLKGVPYADKVGVGVCDEINQTTEAISQAENPTQEVPDEHWWQSWWRGFVSLFGYQAKAKELENFVVVRTIKVASNNQYTVTSGNGMVLSDATGYGVGLVATDPKQAGLPDLVVNEIWLEKSGKEVYNFDFSDTVKMGADFGNEGSGNPSKEMELHFYLSKGYKEDAHSDWRRVGTEHIQPEHLRVGDTKVETAEFKILKFIEQAGIYNIVVCIDHIYDDHNNGGVIKEEHESNNCSSEAVFEVTGTPPPPPPPKTLKITSPDGGTWRTDKEYSIKWGSDNLSKSSHVKVELSLNGGSSWITVDGYATNDGSKKIKLKNFGVKKDTDKARIKITSIEYPKVSDTSKFKIDYKK